MAISEDAGYTYVDEDDYGVHGVKLLKKMLQQSNIVVQCPAMAHLVHALADSETLVIFMLRDVEDIIASQERIGWQSEWKELAKYGLNEGVISQVKYDFWATHQKPRIEHWLEVEYESLSGHPLWVEKKQRANFSPKQVYHA